MWVQEPLLLLLQPLNVAIPDMHMLIAMQDGLDGKVLAEELLALESQFRSSSMNPMGGTKMANDWTVTIDGGAGRYTVHAQSRVRAGVWEREGVRVRSGGLIWGTRP